MKHHYYTDEEKSWLASQSPDLTYDQITAEFNKVFDSDRTPSQISDLMAKRMKIPRTPKGRFGVGAKEKLEVGTEVIKQGYIWVKVNNNYFEGKCTNAQYMTNWRRKSDVVWEAQNGAIPEGKFLIFLDGDRLNCDIDNLYPVSRASHAVMCKNNWYNKDKEFVLGALKYCELIETIKEARRNYGR